MEGRRERGREGSKKGKEKMKGGKEKKDGFITTILLFRPKACRSANDFQWDSKEILVVSFVLFLLHVI